MQITKPQTKQLLFDILTFSEEVNEDGNTMPYKQFPKLYYLGVKKALDKLRSTIDVYAISVDLQKTLQEKCTEEEKKVQNTWRKYVEEKDFQFVPFEEYQKNPQKYVVLGEKWTERPIEFTVSELQAIKHFGDKRECVPDYGESAFEEAQNLVTNI